MHMFPFKNDAACQKEIIFLKTFLLDFPGNSLPLWSSYLAMICAVKHMKHPLEKMLPKDDLEKQLFPYKEIILFFYVQEEEIYAQKLGSEARFCLDNFFVDVEISARKD